MFFLARLLLDPWLIACWGLLFAVGYLASRGLWLILYDETGSLFFGEILDHWLFTPNTDSVTVDELHTEVFHAFFNPAKALIYALIYVTSKAIWKDDYHSPAVKPLTLFIVYLSTLLWIQVGYRWSGHPCSAVYSLVLSPQLTLFGFSLPLFNTWVTGPLAEELTFRGVMFHWLSHRTPMLRILFTASLFAYAHVVSSTGMMAPSPSLVWTVYMDNILFVWLPLGLLFGYARERSGGLLLPFLLHAGHNMLIDCESMLMIATGLCHQ